MRFFWSVLVGWVCIGCSFGQPLVQAQPVVPAEPYADTLRALIVFVKFQDDHTADDPLLSDRGWPLFPDPTTRPLTAEALLAPSPEPPFVDSSLTAYFYEQSNHRFILFGDVYPKTVISPDPEDRYHRPLGGYGDLAVDVLNAMDADGFDFRPYDHNRDGVLDQLFLILRSDRQRDARRFTWTGISCLDARCGGGLTAGGPREAPQHDGIRVDWDRSGSWIMHRTAGNVHPHYYLVRLLAHEFGHDLWANHFVHIPVLGTNDVPFESNRKPPTRCTGYVLMAGAGGGNDCGGDETISAYERLLLGWIDCPVLSSDQEGVRLTDLYTTSRCFQARLPGDRTLHLSNRQRIGPFDRPRRAGRDAQFELGLLRTTGLLITMTQGERFDVLPADNSLHLSASDAPYQGDLFGPETKAQLTPWTKPNISGFTEYPANAQPVWTAIDHIRMDPADSLVLLFDFVEDFRARPVLRADSWMGMESAGTVFDAPLEITPGVTLYLDTEIVINEKLVIRPGGQLVVGPAGRLVLAKPGVLQLESGSTMVLEGTLWQGGLIKRAPRAMVMRKPTSRWMAPLGH